MDERLKEVEDAVGRGEEGEEKLDLLSFLLKNTSWSPTKVVDNVVDLLGAGIDTVCCEYYINIPFHMNQVFTSFMVPLPPQDCQHTPVRPVPNRHQPKYPREAES